MSITSTGTPQNVHATTGAVSGSWNTDQPRTAGDLLVAVVSAGASTSVAATACSTGGWAKLAETGNSATAHVRVAIWAATAAGGDSGPAFTSTESGTAGGMDCLLFELAGADGTLDTSGTYASGSSTATLSAMSAATGASVAASGEFAISAFAQERTAASLTFTDTGSGWVTMLNGNGVSSRLQTYAGEQSSPLPGSALADSGSFSTHSTAYGTGLVVVFAATPVPQFPADADTVAGTDISVFGAEVHAVQVSDATHGWFTAYPHGPDGDWI